MFNTVKQQRREAKLRYKEKNKTAKIRYELRMRKDEYGEDVMVFEEINPTKDRKQLQNIVIGKPENDGDYYDKDEEKFQEIEVDGEDLDEEEKQFLKDMMGDNIEDCKQMKDQEGPEKVERHYQVTDEISDAPIEIEEETVELDKEPSLDFEHAPESKMTTEGKNFLLKQLFGNNFKEEKDLEEEDCFNSDISNEEQFNQEVQDGLDFFNKEVKVYQPQKQDFQMHIKKMQEEASNASDLQFDEEEFQEEEDIDYKDDQFKTKKQKKERNITIEEINKCTLTDEDILQYKLSLEKETSEDIERKIQEYVRNNTILTIKQPQLEDLQSKNLQQKRFINESAMITISKTGVPKNIFAPKPQQKEEEGNEYIKVVMPHDRPKDETEEERQKRKQLVKDAKKLRREQKAELKQEFKAQKSEIQKVQQRQRGNLQGRKID